MFCLCTNTQQKNEIKTTKSEHVLKMKEATKQEHQSETQGFQKQLIYSLIENTLHII